MGLLNKYINVWNIFTDFWTLKWEFEPCEITGENTLKGTQNEFRIRPVNPRK